MLANTVWPPVVPYLLLGTWTCSLTLKLLRAVFARSTDCQRSYTDERCVASTVPQCHLCAPCWLTPVTHDHSRCSRRVSEAPGTSGAQLPRYAAARSDLHPARRRASGRAGGESAWTHDAALDSPTFSWTKQISDNRALFLAAQLRYGLLRRQGGEGRREAEATLGYREKGETGATSIFRFPSCQTTLTSPGRACRSTEGWWRL